LWRNSSRVRFKYEVSALTPAICADIEDFKSETCESTHGLKSPIRESIDDIKSDIWEYNDDFRSDICQSGQISLNIIYTPISIINPLAYIVNPTE